MTSLALKPEVIFTHFAISIVSVLSLFGKSAFLEQLSKNKGIKKVYKVTENHFIKGAFIPPFIIRDNPVFIKGGVV